MKSRQRQAERLGRVVDSLPFETKKAMLDGLRRYERIITGAYSDRDGGVCPMLAAHRCGGRTDFRSFARAWDGFTGTKRRSRLASRRELRTLEAHLETSVSAEELQRAQWRADTEAVAVSCRKRRPRRTSWLGPFRRWDRYRDAVAWVSSELEQVGLLDPAATETSDVQKSSTRRDLTRV